MNITDTKWQFLKFKFAGISKDTKLEKLFFVMYPHSTLTFTDPPTLPPIVPVLLSQRINNNRRNK